MDTLTHTLIGACLGEAIAGKKMRRKAMLFGILSNNLPDADMITALWNSEAHTLLSHRGITHSILFTVLATLALSRLFEKWFSKYQVSRKEWLLLMGSGLFLHILLDACTAYGTGWFEPFSSFRVSFNILFILDPFFSLPMLIGTLLLLIIRNKQVKLRRIVYLSSLGLSVLYLIVTIGIKLHVNSVIRHDLAEKNITGDGFFSTPAPMNNLLWYSAAYQGDRFYTGYYSILDKQPHIQWQAYTRNDSLLAPYRSNEDVKYLVQFSKGLYFLSRNDSGLQFGDIRFGQLMGSTDNNAGFVFNFDVLPRPNQGLIVKQSEFKQLEKKDIDALIQRIKGK